MAQLVDQNGNLKQELRLSSVSTKSIIEPTLLHWMMMLTNWFKMMLIYGTIGLDIYLFLG